MFSGAYGERLGRSFRLSNPPTLLSCTKQGVPLAVTELRIDQSGCGMTSPLGKDDAYLLCLNLAAQTQLELWYEGRPACACDCEAGSFYALDVRRDPITYIGGPLHGLYFYLPCRAIAEMMVRTGSPSPGDIAMGPGEQVHDPIVNSIGQALLPLFHADISKHQPLVDHLLQGLCSYVASSYGGHSAQHSAVRGTLAPWQQRVAKQIMRERLAEGVSINELAQACGLSTGAFVRGFKKSTGISPHQWLLFKRVDLAIDLMEDPVISLAEIAFNAGFSDQSHFSRIFTQRMGVAPGAWRKSLGMQRRAEVA
jgi:AraC-like DNA-binding protein